MAGEALATHNNPPGPGLAGQAPTVVPWGQLLLASMMSLLANVAILNFAPLLPLVREEFGLTNVWAGALASATILSHTMFQLVGGQVADTLRMRRALGLGAALMGLSVLGTGLAPNLGLLLLCRFTLGIGTAISFLGGLTFVNGLVPPERRPVVQGIYGAAGNAGILLVLLFSERLSLWGGWRGAFLLEGVAFLAAGGLLVARLREGDSVSPGAPRAWGEALRNPLLYLLGLAHVLTYGIIVAVTTWAATFLWSQHGIGLEWAGPLAAVMALSAVAARIAGGALSLGRERQAIVLCCFATAAMTGLVALLPGTVPALVALLLLGWFASVPFGAVFSYVSLVSNKGSSGRELSVVNSVANLGALLFPPMVGYALDTTGSFAVGFGLVGAVALVGATVVAVWLPRRGRA